MKLTSWSLAILICLIRIPVTTHAKGSAAPEGPPLSAYDPPLPESFAPLMRKHADSDGGEMVFMRKCSSCHDHEKNGGHGKGPHLWNVMGRKAASIQGFEFSSAMRGSGHTWNFATLNYYLTHTARAVPGLAMEFRGLKKEKDRAVLISFLRTLSDKPVPLP